MTLKEYKRAMHLLNRQARLAKMKAYYQANRERLIQYQREYRTAKKSAEAKP